MIKWFKRLWFKFRFWLAPTMFSYDFGSGDYNCILFYKKLDGVLYIIDEQITKDVEYKYYV